MHYDIYIRNLSRDRNGIVSECILYLRILKTWKWKHGNGKK
nr:MAG TPA: hypothetical protein [Caudoviricetes sp.]